MSHPPKKFKRLENTLKNLSDQAKTIMTIDGVILGLLVSKSSPPDSFPQQLAFGFALVMLLASIFCCIGTINSGIYKSKNTKYTIYNETEPTWFVQLQQRENNALRWYATALYLLLIGAFALFVLEIIIMVRPEYHIFIIGLIVRISLFHLIVLVFLLIGFIILIQWSQVLQNTWKTYLFPAEQTGDGSKQTDEASKPVYDKLNYSGKLEYILSMIWKYRIFSQFQFDEKFDSEDQQTILSDFSHTPK